MASNTFIDRLNEAMELRNMTSSELARRSHIDKSAICRYLKGKITPKPKAAEALARSLGVSPLWLMGYDSDMKVADIAPIIPRNHNVLDISELSPKNRIRIKAYYQALIDTQNDNS